MNIRPGIAALLFVLPLAACKQQPAKDATASGQILPGSISDAMLPEDRVTSQPPIDPRALRTGGSAAAEADATSAPDAAVTAQAAEPAATKAAE